MQTSKATYIDNQTTYGLAPHPFISWRSIAAGFFIALVTYLIMGALGAGIFGLAASAAINSEGGGIALTTGAGIWWVISVAVSLFVGAYTSARLSASVIRVAGAIQGAVLASVFLVFLALSYGSALALFTKGAVNLTATVGEKATDLTSTPLVQDSIQKALQGANLKSEPKEVVQGLGIRLMRGDTESAKSYLSYQTNLPPAEVDSRIAQLRTDFEQATKTAGDVASKAASAAGWSIFVMFIIALSSAIFGGYASTNRNVRHPLRAI